MLFYALVYDDNDAGVSSDRNEFKSGRHVKCEAPQKLFSRAPPHFGFTNKYNW